MATAGSFVALGQALDLRWMFLAGLVIALVGAVGRLVIAVRRLGIERARERTEMDRRTRVPVGSISTIDRWIWAQR